MKQRQSKVDSCYAYAAEREVVQLCCELIRIESVNTGDPDTIVLRDYGLPTMVNYAFTGDARRLPADEGGDEIMCRHLAPWTGHRQRIIRLLYTVGVSVPRRGPRSFKTDIRRL